MRKGHFSIFFLSSKVPPTHPPSHRCLDLDLSFPARSKLLRRGQKLGSPGNEKISATKTRRQQLEDDDDDDDDDDDFYYHYYYYYYHYYIIIIIIILLLSFSSWNSVFPDEILDMFVFWKGFYQSEVSKSPNDQERKLPHLPKWLEGWDMSIFPWRVAWGAPNWMACCNLQVKCWKGIVSPKGYVHSHFSGLF